MKDNIRWAMERLEAAQERADKFKLYSQQNRFTTKEHNEFFRSMYRFYKESIKNRERPEYRADSRARDTWLDSFWRNEPHIAGVVNSAVAIDKNRSWTMTGPRRQVSLYSTILRQAEDGLGWRDSCSIASESFYTADINAVFEVGRNGRFGPMRAIYNVDPLQCRLTGDRDFPLEFYPEGRKYKPQRWSRYDFFRVASMPSKNVNFHRLGWCALSRAAELIALLMAIYEYDQEQLGARAPKGLLLLQNISEYAWKTALNARNQELDEREQEYYGGVMVIAQEGMDEIDAKLVALSRLPDEFDRETVTNQIMYGVALCFGYSPDEFWPVQYGALGRSRETEIHHMRATGKGGSDFVLGFQDKIQREMPDSVLFEFDKRDAETDMLEAEVYLAWAKVVDILWQKGEGPVELNEIRSLLAAKGILSANNMQDQESVVNAGGTLRHKDPPTKFLKQELLERDAIQRCIEEHPDEPIVRYVWPHNKTQVLWQRGEDALKRYFQLHQLEQRQIEENEPDPTPIAPAVPLYTNGTRDNMQYVQVGTVNGTNAQGEGDTA